MAQSNTVMAFRKRLKKRGYERIRIELYMPGLYLVSALEPLARMGVQLEMTEMDMVRWR